MTQKGNVSLHLNIRKRCAVAGCSNSHKDGVSLLVKKPWTRHTERTIKPNGAVLANVRVFVAPILVRTAYKRLAD